jgi:aspartate racemase
MKTIGLIGGMTSESSREYYRIINETVRDRLGGVHSARIVMVSVDLAEIEPLMEAGSWDEILTSMTAAAISVQRAGADFLVICTNTIHKIAEPLQEQIQIPILNLIDVTARAVEARGMKTVGLLGTRFTMEEDFYKGRLERRYGLRVLTPGADDRREIHRVICEELSVGKILGSSKDRFQRIIERLAEKGAEGVILGCTEIPLLVREDEGTTALFDTTRLHCLVLNTGSDYFPYFGVPRTGSPQEAEYPIVYPTSTSRPTGWAPPPSKV